MRLMNTSTWKLKMFHEALCIPPYATLSHCWETDEILFTDMTNIESTSQKLGFAKIKGACLVAATLGIHWIWIDTVCIDKSSSAELTEAINSNFQWYQNCQICLVYLSDFQGDPNVMDDLESQLAKGKWMKRSWTLQELVAPKAARFYNRHWSVIGTKQSLLPLLSNITKVDQDVIADVECLSGYSIGRRMAWAAGRSASRTEDIAYSLLGIFKISMPIIYGEGGRSFARLQEEILKDTDDASLFAWQASSDQQYRGILATSPSEFSHFSTRSVVGPLRYRGTVYASSTGITIESEFALNRTSNTIIFGFHGTIRDCDEISYLGILLRPWNGHFVRYSPQTIIELPGLPGRTAMRIRAKRDVDYRLSNSITEKIVQEESKKSDLWSQKRTLSGNLSTGGSDVDYIYPSSFALCQSPTRSLSFDQTFSHRNSLHLDNEPAWSRSGSQATTSIAPPSELNIDQLVDLQNGCSQFQNDGFPICGSLKPELKPDLGSGNLNISSNSCETTVQCDDDSDDDSDDDMHLFTSLPAEAPILDPTHVLLRFKEELTEYGLAEFSTCIAQDNASGNKRTRDSILYSMRKRLKPDVDTHLEVEHLTDSEDDQVVFVNNVRIKEAVAFACPYFARDPRLHQDCLKRVYLQNIEDVKKHLWAAHRLPHFCPKCQQRFDTASACDQHIRQRRCAVQQSLDIHGISEDQVKMLAKRFDRGMSAVEQWFSVWDIVFPGTTRPKDAYLSGEIETLVCILRDYWERKGKRVISRFVKLKGLWESMMLRNEERDLEALYALILDQMVDKVIDSSPDSESNGTRPTEKVGEILSMLRTIYSRFL